MIAPASTEYSRTQLGLVSAPLRSPDEPGCAFDDDATHFRPQHPRERLEVALVPGVEVALTTSTAV
ncbi:MAG: hypothetical protein AUG48_11605 [Actinobacteria bacterium 13_1_20CM_3_68_9]|nr:MAG: hypothetical protein AUG48_11605 [Actinobacteria bacterium 13_1_20CM_3_68_9]